MKYGSGKIEMEKNLSELLSYFEVPSYVILLVGLALYLIRILNPITLFSSNVVEQMLFSKEQMFSLKVIKHILNTLFWVIVLYPTTFYLRDVIPGPNDFYSYVIAFVGGIIWGIVKITNEGAFSKIKSSRLCKGLFVLVFMICLILFYMELYSFFIELPFLEKEKFNLKVFGWSMLVLFLFTLPIPFILKPISKIIKWSSEQIVYIEDEKKQKWYILYSINKETVLLGNKNEYRLCTKTMIKRKEELYNTPIEMVKPDN